MKDMMRYVFTTSGAVDNPMEFLPKDAAFAVPIAFEVFHPKAAGSMLCYIYVASRAFVDGLLVESNCYVANKHLILNTYDPLLIKSYIETVLGACYVDDYQSFFDRLSRYAVVEEDSSWVPEVLVEEAFRRVLQEVSQANGLG